MSAIQIAQNPFGDYAPQSTQIQGILKSLYDSFTSDLEKANVETADKQKSFEEWMETKKESIKTMSETLENEEMDESEKTKTVAESREIIDKSKDSLEADEEMFAQAKKSCKEKAFEWNQRAHLRTQELAGIGKAIEILTDPDAAETLKAAQETFLQISSKKQNKKGRRAFTTLKKISSEFQSLSIARLAVMVQTGGHFDKVIVQIDGMIADMRTEEQEDIEHRDRCQGDVNQNVNEIADLEHSVSKIDKEIETLNFGKDELNTKIDDLETSIRKTKDDIKVLKELRKEEYNEFKEALKQDQEAIPIIEEAIAELSRFYNENKIPLELVQEAEPRPNTNFHGKYEGGSSRSVVAMMKMIAEDLKNEIKTASEEDSEADEAYIKSRNAMQRTVEKQTESKDLAERDSSELVVKISKLDEQKGEFNSDLGAANDDKSALEKDCGWVKTHFKKRQDARKSEIAGLTEAKNYLAGIDSGNDDDLI